MNLINAHVYTQVQKHKKLLPCHFCIRTARGDFVLEAETEQEKAEWVKAFRESCTRSDLPTLEASKKDNSLGKIIKPEDIGKPEEKGKKEISSEDEGDPRPQKLSPSRSKSKSVTFSKEVLEHLHRDELSSRKLTK